MADNPDIMRRLPRRLTSYQNSIQSRPDVPSFPVQSTPTARPHPSNSNMEMQPPPHPRPSNTDRLDALVAVATSEDQAVKQF